MITIRPRRKYTKSTRSGGSGGNCVEWAFDPAGVYIRDSKNPAGPELLATYPEWMTFVAAAGAGDRHPWVTASPVGISIRKDGLELSFTPAEWTAFVEGIHAGECHPAAA